MRTIAILLWMLLPLGAVAYHYGPGVDGRARDTAAGHIAQAERLLAASDADGAVRAFDAALAALPADDHAEARRLRIERAKARLDAGQLAAASQELAAVVDELESDPNAAAAVVADARAALATTDFYVAWLKRLEGMRREDWEPHTESARQTWRTLAAEAESRGDLRGRDRHAQDLEAVIRLARMEPDELQGLPIPKQCQGCKGGQCRNCRGKKPGRSPQRNKSEDARGASSGPPPDGSGS